MTLFGTEKKFLSLSYFVGYRLTYSDGEILHFTDGDRFFPSNFEGHYGR